MTCVAFSIKFAKTNQKFLTRNSVAVAHVVAQCTNRCTRRKVNVIDQPTNRKTENEEKVSIRKEGKLLELSPRAARLHPEQKGRERETKGGQNGDG